MYISVDVRFSNPVSELVHGVEHLRVSLRLASTRSLVVQAYYRPPRVPFSSLLDALDEGLSSVGQSDCIVCGDFNVNLLGSSGERDSYVDLIGSNGFVVTNDLVTRPVSGRLLDHFLKNFQSRTVGFTFDMGIRTDHNAVVSLYDVLPFSSVDRSRKSVAVDWDKFASQVERDVAGISFSSHPDLMCDELIDGVAHALSDNSYERSVDDGVAGCVWMTPEVKRLIRRRDNLKRSLHRHPLSAFYREMFEGVCRELSELKRRTKRQYFNRTLGKGVSMKNKWRNLNQVLGRKQRLPIESIAAEDGNFVDDPMLIADMFNDYFANIALELAPVATGVSDVSSLGTLSSQSRCFYLEPVTSDEVLRLVTKLSDDKSPGFDGIPPKALKLAAGSIVPLLTDLINKCFATGIVPKGLKVARVTPVFKGGDRNRVSNYRPISVLTVFDKIFEGCLYERLVKFLKSVDFFHSTQYGFREQSGTTGACVELVDDILRAIDEGFIVCTAFFDSSKAFDLVPHDLLLRKLELSGVRGHPLELVRSYLSDRSQFVSVGGSASADRDMTLGVAQGSKLGPLLYLIYTNDLGCLPLKGKVMMYADDIAVLYRCRDSETLSRELQHDMDLISGYFRVNRLLLNVSKSKVMYFGRRSLREASRVLMIDGSVVESVSTFKYLDSNLSFRNHLEYVARKVSCVVGMLRRVRSMVPRHILMDIYFSLIHSNISYVGNLWMCWQNRSPEVGKIATEGIEDYF